MKKVFYAVFAAIVVTLSACGGAHAAPAADCFTASNGVPFCIGQATVVERVGTGFNVSSDGLQVSGGVVTGYAKETYPYADTLGNTWATFKQQAAALDFYPADTTLTKYYNARTTQNGGVTCTGGVSQFHYKSSTENTVANSCAQYNAFKTRVNP
jgi:hypothetical protein